MPAAQIGAAIKARLDLLAFNPAIPVAWPNRDFTPDGSRYLAAMIEAAPNRRLTIGGRHRYSGSMIVRACIPLNGGSGQGDGVADAIAAHFPADLSITLSGGSVLRVPEAPSVRGGYRDDGYWHTPVIIPFEVLT